MIASKQNPSSRMSNTYTLLLVGGKDLVKGSTQRKTNQKKKIVCSGFCFYFWADAETWGKFLRSHGELMQGRSMTEPYMSHRLSDPSRPKVYASRLKPLVMHVNYFPLTCLYFLFSFFFIFSTLQLDLDADLRGILRY